MAYDYYGIAKEICSRLRLSGYENEAHKIEEEIASGSTGTEILMALRYQVSGILDNKLNIDCNLATIMQNLISQINAVLS